MKILHIIPVLSQNYGGPVTVLYQLTKELSKYNHSVTILTSDLGFDKNLSKKFEDSGITIIPVHAVFNIGLYIYTPSVKKWIIANLKSFDIIHMHTFRSYQNSIVSEYAEHFKIPYVVQAHGSVLPFFEKQYLKKMYDFIWGYKILHFARKVIALTNTESDQYQTMGIPKNKIEIIPNCLDLTQFSNLPIKGEFRLKYGISSKDKIILYLGRIHKIKGIDLLITAYSGLLQEFPNVLLVVVGPDDNYLSKIENQINNINVSKKPFFTGPLYGQEKLAAYVDADVYVLPSLYEAFPMTLLEAMLCGTPVIITSNIKNFDWINNKSGFICKNDAADLIKCLQILLNNDDLRRTFGENGEKIVRESNDLEDVVQKNISLYVKLIKTK